MASFWIFASYGLATVLLIGLVPAGMFSLQSFVNRIGRSNRENGHLVSESTHRSCGLAWPART